MEATVSKDGGVLRDEARGKIGVQESSECLKKKPALRSLEQSSQSLTDTLFQSWITPLYLGRRGFLSLTGQIISYVAGLWQQSWCVL
jgi:hypothetical protein